MPFYLHSSGVCTFSDSTTLKPGAGGFKEYGMSRSRRSVFFDRCAPLWYWYSNLNFFTFTLPGTKQEKPDLFYSECLSKLLENVRANHGVQSYVWVAEVQDKRGVKYKIDAPIHFHLVTHAYLDIKGLNEYWCKLIGVYSKNAVDVQHIPPDIDCIPAYLAKYMCKGMSRAIKCRSFGSSRDLKLKPIALDRPPENPYGITIKTFMHNGEKKECIIRYYKTGKVLEDYFQI